MTHAEKARMIHIRLEDEVHRDLRRAAAEEDTSLQELVSRVVSRSVDGGRLLNVTCASDDPAGTTRIVTLSLEEEADLPELTLRERLEVVETLLERLGREVRKLGEMLDEGSSHGEA
jgi:hypothetical protein